MSQSVLEYGFYVSVIDICRKLFLNRDANLVYSNRLSCNDYNDHSSNHFCILRYNWFACVVHEVGRHIARVPASDWSLNCTRHWHWELLGPV